MVEKRQNEVQVNWNGTAGNAKNPVYSTRSSYTVYSLLQLQEQEYKAY
jgi:hypothetical protein